MSETEKSSEIFYQWDLSKEAFSLELDYLDEKEQEEKLWQARTGLNYDSLCGAIETLIFMSDRPISLQKIKNTIDAEMPIRVIHESIERLQKEYEQKHHGIRLMEVAQGYQFRTKATYSRFVQDLFKISSLVLSPTALEVLAMVAYRQPISKVDIEKMRGVDSSHILRALMDKRLVNISGRSEEVGRPALYSTTAEFLEIFNINSIDDLPPEGELLDLAQANSIGEISDIKTIVKNSQKDKFSFDELDELDALSESIKEISADTEFTKLLREQDRQKQTDTGEQGKSAFDLLEEFVLKKQTSEQNKQAEKSELISAYVEPSIVHVDQLVAINEVGIDMYQDEGLTDQERQLAAELAQAKASLSQWTELEEESAEQLDREIEALEKNSQEVLQSAQESDR